MRNRNALLSAVMALALAGCGSKPDGGTEASGTHSEATPAAAAAGTDPCSLVTTAEMGEILGEEIVAAKPGEGSCTYETQDAQASSVTIELDQKDAAGQMDIAKRTAGVLKGMGEEASKQGAAGQDVNAMLSDSGDTPSVGDEAFFGPNTQLSVRKGNSYIAIQPPIMRSRMSGGNPLLSGDDKKRMAMEIAQKAVSRLP
jgi:hypothetical protein